MKRSPSELIRNPPSPRAASVMSMPTPAMPVGWNCTNSMSCNGMPARSAMAMPSPVLMSALVVVRYTRAADFLAGAAEGARVGAAVTQARERHAVMLELDHEVRRRAAHVFDRVLV